MQLQAHRCPNCGASAQAGVACGYCGVVPTAAPVPLIDGGEALAIGAVPCPDCGLANPPGHDHCTRCGARLTRTCFRCRARVYLAAAHCGRCGAALHGAEASAATTLAEARRCVRDGRPEQAERLLVPLVESGAGGVESVLTLAECKHALSEALSKELRFAQTSRAKRFEALELADRVLAAAPDSPWAAAARRLRQELLPPHAEAGMRPGVVAGLVVVAVVVLAFSFC